MSMTLLNEISNQMQDLATVFRDTLDQMRQDQVDWEELERRIAEEIAKLEDNPEQPKQGELDV